MAKTAKSLPQPRTAAAKHRDGAEHETREPIPPPPPEERHEFTAPPASGYRVDRMKEKTAERIREVLAEMADKGETPDYHAVVKRLGDYWHGVDWKTASVKNAVYTQMRKGKGKTKVVVKKRGRPVGTKNNATISHGILPTQQPAPQIAATVAEVQSLAGRIGWEELQNLVTLLRPRTA